MEFGQCHLYCLSNNFLRVPLQNDPNLTNEGNHSVCYMPILSSIGYNNESCNIQHKTLRIYVSYLTVFPQSLLKGNDLQNPNSHLHLDLIHAPGPPDGSSLQTSCASRQRKDRRCCCLY